MLTGKQLDARRARRRAGGRGGPRRRSCWRSRGRPRASSPRGRRSRGRRRARRSGWRTCRSDAQLIFSKAREGVMEKTHGLYPAPLRILEVVAEGLDLPLEEGWRWRRGLRRAGGHPRGARPGAPLLHHHRGQERSRAGGRAERRARWTRVAVVGAGFMGRGSRRSRPRRGCACASRTSTRRPPAKGLRTARESAGQAGEAPPPKRFEVTQLTDRVRRPPSTRASATLDLVVEAVFEDVELKHA
jgi:hypothetical protein